MTSAYQVILLAAGQGKRMKAGRNKQFLTLGGLPLLQHTVRVFERDPWCRRMYLVINPAEEEDIRRLVEAERPATPVEYVEGGKERQDSVHNGLRAVKGSAGELVFIHDAARPFVTEAELHALALRTEADGAAILAAPVKDTVKEVDGEKITGTTDRSRLYAAQTPQAFKLSIIQEAHEKAAESRFLGTDDASLVEACGRDVHIVEGSYENFKVTTPEDLLFAEAVLRRRMEADSE
ncbi:2-C-methyl-D-erythritol 4-phosphate cytidylyltransferase [Alkalicoccus urumqiensis]|uniref:2-C-methyl-D-erythritol 4-phosphate cytidylyltransferase n=1 Tax=Alkalicoccus urumqiensis TaxID=1548213 RepID=A0A2P6MEC3_ALKUR|nr:2-C-methyl-D-erythritol 4-phosphate cytidylyltransferase [Alkalicoccus urumqiensis]PRO64632.1 2-C-methyl-D-erythritol 4-phosphate cytidylyltransferase [Alkalicoccus urumqiensis]